MGAQDEDTREKRRASSGAQVGRGSKSGPARGQALPGDTSKQVLRSLLAQPEGLLIGVCPWDTTSLRGFTPPAHSQAPSPKTCFLADPA